MCGLRVFEEDGQDVVRSARVIFRSQCDVSLDSGRCFDLRRLFGVQDDNVVLLQVEHPDDIALLTQPPMPSYTQQYISYDLQKGMGPTGLGGFHRTRAAFGRGLASYHNNFYNSFLEVVFRRDQEICGARTSSWEQAAPHLGGRNSEFLFV